MKRAGPSQKRAGLLSQMEVKSFPIGPPHSKSFIAIRKGQSAREPQSAEERQRASATRKGRPNLGRMNPGQGQFLFRPLSSAATSATAVCSQLRLMFAMVSLSWKPLLLLTTSTTCVCTKRRVLSSLRPAFSHEARGLLDRYNLRTKKNDKAQRAILKASAQFGYYAASRVP